MDLAHGPQFRTLDLSLTGNKEEFKHYAPSNGGREAVIIKISSSSNGKPREDVFVFNGSDMNCRYWHLGAWDVTGT